MLLHGRPDSRVPTRGLEREVRDIPASAASQRFVPLANRVIPYAVGAGAGVDIGEAAAMRGASVAGDLAGGKGYFCMG